MKIPGNSKLGLGTIKFESGASDFPPAGPKKESYVEMDTFRKIEKYTSGPSNSSPGSPMSPQRVRKKKIMSKWTHSEKLKNISRDHQIRVRGV